MCGFVSRHPVFSGSVSGLFETSIETHHLAAIVMLLESSWARHSEKGVEDKHQEESTLPPENKKGRATPALDRSAHTMHARNPNTVQGPKAHIHK